MSSVDFYLATIKTSVFGSNGSKTKLRFGLMALAFNAKFCRYCRE